LWFEGVDYYASVWIDDHFIGRHEGHFAPFDFDVTEALITGKEHLLTVCVSSPWDDPNPRGMYPLNHVKRGLVKGLYEHGEGLIPPAVNPLGIWRPVWLLLDDGLSLDHIRIRTETDGVADLLVKATNATGQPWQGDLTLMISAENHDGPGSVQSLPLTLSPGAHAVELALSIPEPRMWWPWDHGEPNLYRLRAELCDSTGRALSAKEEVFGLRTVKLHRSPQRFTYQINERPVFMRGTSYMPDIYLSRCDPETLERDLMLAHDANLNLLRLHVHVSPPELYHLCDRMGMLVWQDFELHWIQDSSPEFEARALRLQREMIAMLGNHPSIITWACHNEPTMVFARRQNLEQRPDPALYDDARQEDPTRPVFICSGQLEDDWQRSGDTHTYYGAIWSRRYTDVYRRRFRLSTEFGFETPAHADTLRKYPEVWSRLDHLSGQIEALWEYQARLTQFHIEHFRRLWADGCAGYVQFWLVDLVPQVGCGVLDSTRRPKGGYEALRLASQPLHVALEHDGRRPYALWVFNDTMQTYPDAIIHCRILDTNDNMLLDERYPFDIAANASQRVTSVNWRLNRHDCQRIELAIIDAAGRALAQNHYAQPFNPPRRPRGYPWKFDHYLGTKVFDRPGARSLADENANRLVRLIPLAVRETAIEWSLRQRLPLWMVAGIARLLDRINL
jgi:beta-mannosidase